ncbi:MAG: IreB family regulatory phosphoprotein [Bacillota bacterium]
MAEEHERTAVYRGKAGEHLDAREVLKRVYQALQEKGYNPIFQIAGYLLSGDPVYITAHNEARSLARKLDREEVLEELLRFYLGCDRMPVPPDKTGA